MMNIADESAVLTASNLNISIFSQVWLVENYIFDKKEFKGNFLFSPVVVSIPTPTFDFLVVPERLQVVVKSDFEGASAIFSKIIGGIVKALPHTPFTGIGLNFNYLIEQTDQERFRALTRDFVLSEGSLLRKEFDTDDSRYGLYVSKNIFNGRLRLDMKPIKRDTKEMLLLNFNFHNELSKADDVSPILDTWNDRREYSRRIVEMINEFIG